MTDKRLRLAVVLVLAVLVLGGLWNASANRSGESTALASIQDIFNGKLFSGGSIFSNQPAPSLYKPAEDYERAVIDAVKSTSPAVVSITISKKIPTYQNCSSYNPFNNLPPQLRQFFGGDFPDVNTNCENGSRIAEIGGGSGFIISKDGLIVTNKHVVSDTEATYTVITNDGNKYDARVLARDPIQDIAVLKVEASGLPTVTLGDSDNLELGQAAIAIGNALGEFKNTVSVGVVSGLGRSITAVGENGAAETIQGVLQTDAAINPGNSGGPLVNLRGEVVGINVAIVSGAQNIGFALPINWAKHDIDTVMKGGKLKAPYLGVRYQKLTPDLAEEKKLSVDYGALVAGGDGEPAVVKDSPADKAGLKEGDVILSLGGKSLRDADLLQLIALHSVGDNVDLDVFRDKRTIKVTVTLGERK